MEAISQMNWSELVQANEEVKNYQDFQSFEIGDVIKHEEFGLGYIQESFGNKIEVLFEDKVRTLTHLLLL